MLQEETHPNSNNINYWIALNEWIHLSYKPKMIAEIKNSLDKTSIPFDFHTLFKNTFMDGFISYLNKFNIQASADIIKNLQDSGIKIFTYIDETYPQYLRTIDDPPMILFHRGKLTNFDNCIAIVGTRNPTHFAHKKARELARVLARRGYTIVSGLARGIDTEAHCGALDVNGKTIAVLGTKINEEIYPKENSRLSEDISKSGAILSEAPLFQYIKDPFIKRNRITSGISKCLVVIEFGSSGGTLTQVNHALKQGRKVFVLKSKVKDKIAMDMYTESINNGAVPFKSNKEIIDFLKLDKSIRTFDKFS